MKISVLTSTYNRACLLDKLYTSILINSNTSNFDVEWLIMDDGSMDNTRIVASNYAKEGIIDVKYYYHENAGKMKSINELVSHATGDLLLECDSDDFLASNAFKEIEYAIGNIENLDEIYALVFLKYDQNGDNMGNDFPENNYESTMFDLYFKENITGEKALVYNTKIRKMYNYETEEGEKFVTEARLHHQMDLKYKVRCFNKKIMICEYKADGYTKNIMKLFKEYPNGYYEYFREVFDQNMNGVTFKKRMYIYKHYILFSVLAHKKNVIRNVKGFTNKVFVILLYIPGKIATKIKMK